MDKWEIVGFLFGGFIALIVWLYWVIIGPAAPFAMISGGLFAWAFRELQRIKREEKERKLRTFEKGD